MAKRGRPPTGKTPVVFFIHLRLYPEHHSALIEYLQAAPRRLRAQYVLRAMQSGAEALSPQLSSSSNEDDDLNFESLLQ